MEEHRGAAAVAGVHRVVRTLADGEGPFAGELVTRGAEVAVRMDAGALLAWPGWRYAGAEHIAAPRDLALRLDGQDVLLPWCVCTAQEWTARRAAEDGDLPNGEAVTLVVSMLRGLGELPADRAEEGQWWVGDDGRPMFVLGVGDADVEATRVVVASLEDRTHDRALGRVLGRVRNALEDRRRLRAEAPRWEKELLEVAAPRPLRMSAQGPDVDPLRLPVRGGGSGPVRRRDLRSRAAGHGSRAVGVVAPRGFRRATADAARWGDAARSRVISGLGRVARPRGSGSPGLRASSEPAAAARGRGDGAPSARRRWRGPAIAGAGIAIAVAVLGASWPESGASGAGGADGSDRARSAAPATSAPEASPEPTHREGVGNPAASPQPSDVALVRPGAQAGKDPLAAAAGLLAAARRCGQNAGEGCEDVWDDGSREKTVRGTDEAPLLVEDYGDVAAVRNPAADGAQMVVIIRRNAEWRIRDVYDIADPPSVGAGAP